MDMMLCIQGTYLTILSIKAKDWEELSVFGEFGPLALDYLDFVSEKIPEISISNGRTNPEFSLDFLLI